jgi:hypothetical protein
MIRQVVPSARSEAMRFNQPVSRSNAYNRVAYSSTCAVFG